MNLGQNDKTVFSVAIQLAVRSATTSVRFPCLLSVQWRTNNQKVSVETAKYSPQGGKADFNEDLLMRTEIGYDKAARRFLKKETQVQLNLTSKSRPDQSKLVGRVTIDLALLLNDRLYAEPTEFPLQFCSVNAALLMSFKVVEQTECDLSLSELEPSIGDGFSLSSALRLGVSSVKEKGRQSAEVSSENVAVSNFRGEPQPSLKRQLSPSPSPSAIEARTASQIPAKRETAIKEMKESAAKEMPQSAPEQKPATRSFKSINEIRESMATRKSEATEDLSQFEAKEESKKSSFKKMGSVSSEDGRISEDISRQRLENDRMRMEADRYKAEAEANRLQAEKARQQLELAKLELKQKKTTADQSASESSTVKAELARLREELSKSREESVSLTLRLAELREAHNKSLVQASVSERQLTKLEGINERLQALLIEKEQVQSQSKALQGELSAWQSRCDQLQLERTLLKSTLSNLDQLHQEALSKCSEHEEALSHNRGSFESEVRVLREQLKAETRHRIEAESQIQTLNEEVERLISVANEFEEARHSWEITQNLNTEEVQGKNGRIKQLQENLLGLDERVRWLEGENELLTENARRNREEYLRIKAEKDFQGENSSEAIRRYEQVVQELQSEKQRLEAEVYSLQELVAGLQQQGEELRRGSESQTESILQLETSLAEVALKNNELEELVLNINELRDKERLDNAEKEMGFVLRVAELEGSNRQLQQLAQANAERVGLVEEELRGREGLIVRLQEGLRTQVERSEQLNNRVMHFLEKEERMKETLLIIQLESKRVTELLSEQEARDGQSQLCIQQLELKNAELMASLQESISYGRELEELSKSNQNTAGVQIAALANEVEKKTAELAQSKSTIESRNSKIKDLEEKYRQSQTQSRQNSAQNQKIIDSLKSQLASLQSDAQALQSALEEKSVKLAEVEGELSSTHAELAARLTSIDQQTAEFERLCGQLKEIELVHERQLHQAEVRELEAHSRQQELENAYLELENATALKEQSNSERICELERQISQLKNSLAVAASESTTVVVTALKKEVKEKSEEIRRLQGELKAANAEVVKVPNLERSLKIKSIELSSMKFKGKSDGYEGNELLRLKDEEISSLTAERDRLLANESELQALREKSEALATELQLIEEEKFNIESQSNERALQLEEAREENKKLMEEITIIGERNGELERTLQEVLSSDSKASKGGDAALKAEVMLLRGQVRELEQARQKVLQLEQTRKKMQEDMELKEEEHMIALIDQQFKLAKADSQTNSNSINSKQKSPPSQNDPKQLPNLATTYRSLREIIDERLKSKIHERLTELIHTLLAENEQREGVLPQRSRELSRQFQRLKIQVLKFDGKAGQERLKLVALFKTYEGLLADVVRLSEAR